MALNNSININKTILSHQNNIVIGSDIDFCFNCAAERVASTEESYSEAVRNLRAEHKFAGKPLKVFAALRDPFGERVYFCEDCLKKMVSDMEETKEDIGYVEPKKEKVKKEEVKEEVEEKKSTKKK